MSTAVIRPYELRDDEGFRHVRAVAYRHGEPVDPADKLLREDCLGFVAELDKEIVAATTVIDMKATKGEGALRCAGIAAVGVVPEKRRGGVGTKMMTEILDLLRKQGFQLCSLYPFSAAYYRRFGYEYCGHRLLITCPTHRLPRIKPDFDAVHIPYEERERIYPVYEKYAHRYAAMNLRNEDQWWRVLGGDTPMQIYAFGEPIEGYILVKLNSDFWNNQNVKELVWTSERAYKSILAFLTSLGINKTAIAWPEPGDSAFFASYMDQGVTAHWHNDLMYRVLDIPGCLGAIRREERGEFSFHCDDPAYPANSGSWQVCYGPEGTRVERGGSPDFEIPIGVLTQALLGEPSFETLAGHGRVKTLNPAALGKAIRFFGSQTVYCMDYF